ncbi:MAG: Cof-type HAD-IIB family hydrolase [candidate division KSB1 bacterium]|nr:Cof-type HAD-IIB family hydrolase [candidate division KSB1 bacterium]MDZ7319468.1 Cof-type HAD-IIB family hydrolase [candidate division KSB1 bacterium]MDZ7342419.1 Cof-type HAD-IIB family hydrolase [candidate division KSB1 bacterium]
MPASKIRMVVTDLDGTLLNADRCISATDEATLRWLGEQHVCRVAATGRSLYSAQKVLSDLSPIDYLIFSCGAGIVNWPAKDLLLAISLSPEDVARITHFLHQQRLDFQILDPVPESHKMVYYQGNHCHPDFLRRLEHYREFAQMITFPPAKFAPACEVLVILNADLAVYAMIAQELSDYKVIRATSPLDSQSLWVEIFARQVSKGNAAAWLCTRLGCHPESVMAIGNDYNDLDLLHWAAQSFVVANAPEDLKSRFKTTRSHNENGFTEAVHRMLLT